MNTKMDSPQHSRAWWTSGNAEALMRKAGFEPLEPYPGKASSKWRCKCQRCGHESNPRPTSIKGGRGCYFCGRRAVSQSMRKSPTEAEGRMKDAGLVPLEPYPGTDAPWRCRCLRCGKEVRPALANIRRGGGCSSCARRLQLDPDMVAAELRRVGLEPLEPYTLRRVPVRCRCLACGTIVSPRYDNIRRSGSSGCRTCARYTFRLTEEAIVYVLQHPELGAVKVGVTGGSYQKRRLREFRGGGWTVMATWEFSQGRLALRVEQAVLKKLRESFGNFLDSTAVPQKGHTETFDERLVSAGTLCRMVEQQFAEGDRDVVEAAHQPPLPGMS